MAIVHNAIEAMENIMSPESIERASREYKSKEEIYERNCDIEARFLKGEIMESIGDSYGITRERVRQILDKRGVKSEEGGAKLTRRLSRRIDN